MKYIVLVMLALTVNSVFAGEEAVNGYVGILRAPDSVLVKAESGDIQAVKNGGEFTGGGAIVKTAAGLKGLEITLDAPETAVKYVGLRWNSKAPDCWKYLGDAWERAYGDLEWKPLDARREMPWYFLCSNTNQTHAYGVMTGPGAMCSWRVDSQGVVLTLDVRNGGNGVRLGKRQLEVCTVVSRKGKSGETAFDAARAFCQQMCPSPRLPKEPVYGFLDWYCDYGKNSAESVRWYADYIVRLSPKGGNRPFMVIDDGWQPGAASNGGGGPWDCGNKNFPSMEQIAADIRKAGARPGLWVRLLTAQNQPKAWRLERDSHFLDPSVPEVRNYIKEMVARFRGWGFVLMKHDFSTTDLMGQYRTASAAADAKWSFADKTRTSAEIVRDFYQAIREAAGDNMMVEGCQTISHLSAGIFELARIGDDTSGYEWTRTRKMGINCLAFRAAQHGTFYAADADCVGLKAVESIPWQLNRQWMDLVANSGTPLLISIKKGALSADQEKEVISALAIAAQPQPLGEPLDWFETIQPQKWKLRGEVKAYDWNPKPVGQVVAGGEVAAAASPMSAVWLAATRDLSPAESKLAKLAKETLLGNIVSSDAWKGYRGIIPSASTYKGIWNWDAAFHAIGVSLWDPQLAREQILILYDKQLPNGMLPDVVWPNGGLHIACTKPPVMTWAIAVVDRRSPDTEFLRKLYPKLVKFSEFWMNERGGKTDGLFYPAGCDAGWDSGCDDSIRFDKGYRYSKSDQHRLWTVDLNCYMVMHYRAMAYIAGRLNLPEDQPMWLQKADTLAKRINEKLWDDQLGFYVDRDRVTGENGVCLSSAALLPLFVHITSPERAARIAKMTEDPAKFYPGMPCVAYDTPGYQSSGYCRGPTWLYYDYFAFKGLQDYGFGDLADRLRSNLLNWIGQDQKVIWEYYDSKNGKGFGATAFCTSSVFILAFLHDWKNDNLTWFFPTK